MPCSEAHTVTRIPARRRLAIAVSGGVDSLCALLLLKRQGHEVFAIHALLTPDATQPEGLVQACLKLGVELRNIDLREIFSREIITGYENDLLSGLTPNPCAHCNRHIKFGAIFHAAMSLGADALATGHYCSLTKPAADGARLLAPALDSRKDQSYFLALVKKQTLTRLEFPLGRLTKSQCRQIVASAGLQIPMSKESQDICFLANNSRYRFLRQRAWRAALLSPGPILLREAGQENAPLNQLRRLGSHSGIAHYTTGQRKGLDCSWNCPLYVRERHISANCLVVSPISMLSMSECVIANPNFIVPPRHWPSRPLVRLRYKQPLSPCRIATCGATLRVFLEKPRFATAPGQIAAFHDQSGNLLGGGIIVSVSFSNPTP